MRLKPFTQKTLKPKGFKKHNNRIMTKAECFSKGCPFILKKRETYFSNKYGISACYQYICAKCNQAVRLVKKCPKDS